MKARLGFPAALVSIVLFGLLPRERAFAQEVALDEGFDAIATLPNGLVYAFSGGQYVRWTDEDAMVLDEGYPKQIDGYWGDLPLSFNGGVDAAAVLPDGLIYLFRGDQYVRFSDANGTKVDEGYPKPIKGHWGDLPESFNSGVDAAAVLPNGLFYLFQGDQYVRFSDENSTKVDEGYPKPIKGHWGDLPESFNSGIDAAAVLPNGLFYLFQGDQYVRFSDENGTVVDEGYPAAISGNWGAALAGDTSALTDGALQAPTSVLDLGDSAQVQAYLEPRINNDDAIIAFYRKVNSWDRMRELRHLELPQPIWEHLADARTHLVKRLYAEVHAETCDKYDVYLDDPAKESHFIGTPPSDQSFKGVFSDLDVGMYLDPDPPESLCASRASTAGVHSEKELTLPEREALQIRAKRALEAKLATYGPDSGQLFDTNLYTTPEMFDGKDLGAAGVAELERYDDVLAYLAIRIGCGSDEVRWLDFKQRLLNRARQQVGLEQRVLELVEEAERKYDEFERLKREAIADAVRKGQEVYPGLDEQAITRHFEDRLLTFIEENRERLSSDGPEGAEARTQYNKRKADYEASLRESYFTFAAQTYIVKWRSLNDSQKEEFLSDPNRVRRVRADQARFILHYLHEPAGTAPEALRFKLQKIAKYEQRELKVVRDAHQELESVREAPQKLFTVPGFSEKQVEELFTIMKGKVTPEEAWRVWAAWNYNLLNKRDLSATVPTEEMDKAEDYATIRAQAYLDHIEEKLVDIVTELPSFQE